MVEASERPALPLGGRLGGLRLDAERGPFPSAASHTLTGTLGAGLLQRLPPGGHQELRSQSGLSLQALLRDPRPQVGGEPGLRCPSHPCGRG